MTEHYIGLMSGTSCDSIDAVLVDLSDRQRIQNVACHEHVIPADIKQQINGLIEPGDNEIHRLGELDRQLGELFAKAVFALLEKTTLTANDIRAIGSHGQNIRHQPRGDQPFTLQIADPNTIAERTGITTVADFRRRNLAQGGQAAPLTPAFHREVFASDSETRIVLNIGGIANITLLDPAQDAVIGFDTGPGNTLLDTWILQQQNKAYDADGSWAAQGTVNEALLQCLLADSYFQQSAPKSTGREYFNLNWLQPHLQDISAIDVQATLAELTACSIANAIKASAQQGTVIVCGGGVFNRDLLQRLQRQLTAFTITSSDHFGIVPQWVEAIAFAWFAQQTLSGNRVDLCSVTGADKPTVLGGIYLA